MRERANASEVLGRRREVGSQMGEAAVAWLGSLDAGQRSQAEWDAPAPEPAADAERRRWYYTPTDHGGLALGAQRPPQQRRAMRLVASGLSEAGYVTVATVMGLENVLDRLESWSRDWGFDRGRDPARYWLRVFGRPDGDGGVWGWRFGGHHVSLNYLVVGGEVVATTPCFLGADPAASPLLAGGILRPLGTTEDLGRELLVSLDDDQRQQAMLHDRAPSDIVTGNRSLVAAGDQMIHMNQRALWRATLEDERLLGLAHQIDAAAEAASGYAAGDHRLVALGARAAGLAGSALDAAQRELLRRLVGAYEGRAPTGLWAEIDDARLDVTHFAWAGGQRQGDPHYYRIEGPGLLVEYDNTQRSAKHVHAVWRRPNVDFGVDALREHRARAHRPG